MLTIVSITETIMLGLHHPKMRTYRTLVMTVTVRSPIQIVVRSLIQMVVRSLILARVRMELARSTLKIGG